jgi:hypothetical protein
MHTGMWENPATRANVAALVERGARIVGPGSGPLAAGDEGMGRLAEPEEILAAVEDAVARGHDLAEDARPDLQAKGMDEPPRAGAGDDAHQRRKLLEELLRLHSQGIARGQSGGERRFVEGDLNHARVFLGGLGEEPVVWVHSPDLRNETFSSPPAPSTRRPFSFPCRTDETNCELGTRVGIGAPFPVFVPPASPLGPIYSSLS